MPENQEPTAPDPHDPHDPKEQMRLALERKQQQAADRVESTKHGESVHGKTDTHAQGAKRQFRRKAGD